MWFTKPDIEKLKLKGDIKGLIKVVNDDLDSARKAEAAEALGQVGKEAAVNTLSGILFSPHNDVSFSAVKALGNTGSKKAVILLLNIIDEYYEDNDCSRGKDFLTETVNSIKKLGWEPQKDLTSFRFFILDKKWGKLKEFDVNSLGKWLRDAKSLKIAKIYGSALYNIGNAGIEKLIDTLGSTSHGGNGASNILKENICFVIDRICERLLCEDSEFRIRPVAKFLREADEARAADILAQKLKQNNRFVREIALEELEAMRWLPKKYDDKKLAAVIRKDWNSVKDIEGVPYYMVVDGIVYGNDEDRKLIRELLTGRSDAKLVECLIPFVDYYDREVQEAVISILCSMGTIDSISILLNALNLNKSENWNTRWAIKENLIKSIQYMGSDTRKYIMSALPGIDQEISIELVINGLKDKDSSVFLAAANSLEKIDVKAAYVEKTYYGLVYVYNNLGDTRSMHKEYIDRFISCKIVSNAVKPDAENSEKAIRLLMDIGYYSNEFAKELSKKVQGLTEDCSKEDTSHGGLTLWQVYGSWISAAKDFLKESKTKGMKG